jgi:hypothetical protein
MIIGAHSIIYSAKPDADRAFLRDVLAMPNVDVGGGWLIFGLPPAEVAVHPSDENGSHELYLMCDDVEAFIADMQSHAVVCSAVQNPGWGLLTKITLPGGGKLGVYQPRHARPEAPQPSKPARHIAPKLTAKKKAAPTKKKAPAKKSKVVARRNQKKPARKK